jgi:hypothetical protein
LGNFIVVMNLQNRVVTQHHDIEFDSLMTTRNKLYGVNSLGISEITGTTDNGTAIEAFAEAAVGDGGSDHNRIVRHFSLHGSTSKDFYLEAEFDGQALKKKRYLVAPRTKDTIISMRRKASSRHKGRSLVVTLRNKSGSRFLVSSIGASFLIKPLSNVK